MLETKLFDNIYVINLESSIERHNHIVSEFKRMNIKNYEIFKATTPNSYQVKEISDKVKKFPPCFRCNKNICNCYNNFLKTIF